MDSILYFLPLAGLISLVCSGTRHEAFEDILKGAIRIFLYLTVGTAIFAGLLQISVQWTSLFYLLLAVVLGLLAFYTLKEIHVWNPGVFRIAQPLFYGFALYGLDTVWLKVPLGTTPKIVLIAAVAIGFTGLETFIESRRKTPDAAAETPPEGSKA